MNPADKLLSALDNVTYRKTLLKEASELIESVKQGQERLWEIAKELDIDLSFTIDAGNYDTRTVDLDGENWNSSSKYC